MIISRYLIKEILNTLLAMTFFLLLVFLSNRFIQYLSYAASGKLPTNILLQLMGFEVSYLLALLLPLGLYLGIIMAYGRLYAESELRVLHACGLSLRQLISITGVLIFIIASFVLILTLWINPWIFAEKEKLIAKSLSLDNVLNNLMPGRFQVSNDGKRVLYVQQIDKNRGQAKNLFLADQGKESSDDNTSGWTVVSAAFGTQVTDVATRDRFMVAMEGNRYEGMPGQNDFKIIHFKKYAVRIPSIVETTQKHPTQETLTTKTLWQNYNLPEKAAELQWRISIPISVILLGILAVPLSKIKPRYGRYSQLLPALLIYVIYINLLFISRNWVEQKILPIPLGMWSVHLLVLGCVLIFIYFQSGLRFKNWKRLP